MYDYSMVQNSQQDAFENAVLWAWLRKQAYVDSRVAALLQLNQAQQGLDPQSRAAVQLAMQKQRQDLVNQNMSSADQAFWGSNVQGGPGGLVNLLAAMPAAQQQNAALAALKERFKAQQQEQADLAPLQNVILNLHGKHSTSGNPAELSVNTQGNATAPGTSANSVSMPVLTPATPNMPAWWDKIGNLPTYQQIALLRGAMGMEAPQWTNPKTGAVDYTGAGGANQPTTDQERNAWHAARQAAGTELFSEGHGRFHNADGIISY